MSDLPIRKARTKREKNKSYNDSRNQFRASMKSERTENATSEEDEKIKKMKVDGQAANVSCIIEDIVRQPVDKKLSEEKDIKDGQCTDYETGEVKKTEDIMKKTIGESSKNIAENYDEAQGSSKTIVIEDNEKKANKANNHKYGTDASFTWEESFESDEDEKEIHAKKYFTVGISTPPAKTTSEEENTDDEDKDDDSDITEIIGSASDPENKDKDDDGSGGGTSSFEDKNEGEGNGDAGEGNAGDAAGGSGGNSTKEKNNVGSAGGNFDDCESATQNMDTDIQPPDDSNTSSEPFSDEEMEVSDNTGELNQERKFDPYDFSDDDDVEDDVSVEYDRYEFLSEDGGSDHGSDFSFPGHFPDEMDAFDLQEDSSPFGRGMA